MPSTNSTFATSAYSSNHWPQWLIAGVLAWGVWSYLSEVVPVLLIAFLGVYLLVWPVGVIERSLIGLLSRSTQLMGPKASTGLHSKHHADGLTEQALNRQQWLFIRALTITGVFTVFAVGLTLAILLLGPELLIQGRVFVTELPATLIQTLGDSLVWLEELGNNNPLLGDLLHNLFPNLQTTLGNSQPSERAVSAWLNDSFQHWLTQHMATIGETVTNTVGSGSQQIWQVVTGTAHGLMMSLIVLASMFYSLLHGPVISEKLVNLMPPAGNYRQECRWLIETTHHTMLGFLKGQVLLGMITGLYMGIVYTVFGVKYAILLGVMFGVVEILPVIGTWLGIIPGLLVAWLSGGWWAVFGVWICSYIYQTIKDNIVAPKVVGDVLGLHPLLVLLAILVFGKVGGLLGIIYAMPACGLVWACWQRYRDRFASSSEVRRQEGTV